MIDELALNDILDALSAASVSDRAAAHAINPCDTWMALRPNVVRLIALLNDVAIIFPKAKLAAQALDAVRTLLDQLCSVAPQGNSIDAQQNPLIIQLHTALRPGSVPAVAEPPCDVWRRLRPVVIQTITALRVLAQEFPALARVADVLDTLQHLADALCGAGASAAQTCSTASKSYVAVSGQEAVRRKMPARNYIKYPAPQSLRPRTGGPFKVAELCRAYHFPTGLGSGGVIGILELGGGFLQSDLDTFSSLNGLQKINAAAVPVNGGSNTPGGGADAEVLLDIQVAAAAYYYCTGAMPTINVYFAPNDDASFVAVIQRAVSDGCDVLSISWGKDESGWDPTAAKQVESAAEAAAQAGCILFAASGDNSSGDSATGANVDMPSSCPHIIGCGGTTKTPSSEEVWGDGIPDGRGTGGGFSVLFSKPTWQVGAPPIAASRMVPDVAADADPNTGYLVVINGQEMAIGGTSAVAPLYSGLFAAFGRKLGFVTPTLWQNPGAFQDIIKGSNGSFQATYGPDPCTGLGVPIGDALAALFKH